MTVTTDPTVPRPGDDARTDATRRVERLNTASLRRVIEPDVEVVGSLGPGPLYARELTTVADLDLDLTDDQWATLTREEMASVWDAGIRFEALLMSGFALQVAHTTTMADPRTTYMLHEMGEETRHSRLFLRAMTQLAPTARSFLDHPVARGVYHLVTRWVVRRPATLFTLVLAGEEIPDLLQRKLIDHPDTDPFLRDISRYHRMEEARHLSYARLSLPELWARASAVDRFAVRHLVPAVIGLMFDGMVQPGVYETVGLPGAATWRAVARTRHQLDLRYESTRAVATTLLDAGVLRRGRVPGGWRRLAGIDRSGQPLTA